MSTTARTTSAARRRRVRVQVALVGTLTGTPEGGPKTGPTLAGVQQATLTGGAKIKAGTMLPFPPEADPAAVDGDC